MEYVTLNNGVKMPMEGFGVFQVSDPQVCEQSVCATAILTFWLIYAKRWRLFRQ